MILHIGDTQLDLTVDDSSYRERGVGRKNELTLNFSLDHHIEVPVGAWCEFQGQRYELYNPNNFKETGYREYEYTLILEGEQAKLRKYRVRNTVDKRLKFDMTAKPVEFAQLMVDNLNMRDSGWTVGTCTDAVAKCLNFNHNSIEDVAGQVEQAFEVEVYLVGKSINIGKQEVNKDEPLALAVGSGLKEGVKRDNAEETNNIEVVFVQGGDRNIDFSKYGSKELLLPKNQTIAYNGRTYTTDAEGYSVRRSDIPQKSFVEDSLDLSNIYPMREGTVSEVVVVNAEKNFYDFKDSSIPAALDFSTCRIAGERATVMFLTGMLAQRTFDIEQTEKELTGYVHAERRFKLVPAELDGVSMPNATFKPAVGDKYAVFGISMPDAYVCDNVSQTGASWDMLKEAVKYLYDNESSKFNITAELDGIWAKKDWVNRGGKIVVGGYVQISDSKFNPNGDVTRIVSIKDYVNNPHSPSIEITNSANGGSFVSSIKKLQGQEVAMEASKKELVQYTKRRFRDTQETAKMLEQALLNFSGAINPITVQSMQMLVGDESLQYRFVSSKTAPSTVTPSIYYTASTKIFHADGGIIQHMTIGITSVKPSRPASEYKYWDVTAFNSPAFDDATKSYYVYLKCSKSNQTASYYLSETPIGLEQVDGYYHLWVGILNSEFEGDRSFVKMFGFTEILPGRVTAEMFSSPDGNTFIDLVNGIMQGKFTFKSGSKGLEQLSEWANKQSQIDGAASTAAAASATAAAAQTSANSANAAIADMASDGKLSPVEKQSYKVMFDGYTSEKAKYDAQADQFAVSRVSYDAAYDALNAYLTPLLANLATTSDIASATFTSTLKGYTDARTDLANAIAAKTKTLADSAQAKVDNMKIGGVNLIQSVGLTSYVPNNSTPILDGATRSIRTTINALDSLSLASSKINLIPAGVYTASGYLKRNGAIVTSAIWKDVRFQKYFPAIRSKIDDSTGYFEITQEIDSRLFFIDMPLPIGTQVGDVFEWVELKFEKGNKATDYTIAPEDITADASAKADAARQAAETYATSQAAYEREVAKDHADGIVTAEEQARINQAAQNLETAKNDAQTKSDAAKAAAIAAAAVDAQNRVDNIQIGGRNIVSGTKYFQSNIAPNYAGGWSKDTSLYNGCVVMKKASTNWCGWYVKNLSPITDSPVVISFYARIDLGTATVYSVINPSGVFTKGRQVTTSWSRFEIYFSSGCIFDNSSNQGIFEFANFSNSTTIYVAAIQVERGNKATDWTPAPEDVDAEIDNAKQQAISAQADATFAKARTQGRTTIDGGVVETQIVQLGEGGVAGLSGIPVDGSNNHLPSRWAGGTYAQAIAKLATIVEWFNGEAKYGDFWINTDGSICIKDANGVNRVVMTRNDITTLYAIANSTQNTTVNNSADYTSVEGITTVLLTNSIVVNNNNSTVTITATLNASVDILNGNGEGAARIYIYLNNTSTNSDTFVGAATARALNQSDSVQVVLNNALIMPSGTYKIKVVHSHDNYQYGSTPRSSISASTTTVYFDGSTQRTEFGKNGVGIIGNATNYAYMGMDDSTFKIVEKVSSSGVYDKPGILATASVSSGASHTNKWGAKVSSSLITKGGTGIYIVPHSIGNATFTAIVTPTTDNINCRVTAKSTTTFTVTCRNTSNTATDASFDYTLIGSNS